MTDAIIEKPQPQPSEVARGYWDAAREGRFAPREFTQRDSGPFGLEVPEWMPLESAKKAFHEKVRGLNGEWLPPPGEWYDLHATNWPRTIDDKTLDLIA